MFIHIGHFSVIDLYITSTNLILQAVCKKVSSLEALHDKSEHELKKMLTKKNAKEEEIRRLSRALHNLRRYTGKTLILK